VQECFVSSAWFDTQLAGVVRMKQGFGKKSGGPGGRWWTFGHLQICMLDAFEFLNLAEKLKKLQALRSMCVV
jgi:hypothetical protein